MSISYFDTSVLLPALVAAHPQHQRCKDLLLTGISANNQAATAGHTYAELFSNLTKLPYQMSIQPKQVLEVVSGYLVRDLTTIDLTEADYVAALRRCAELNLVSGIIYDALHLQAAIKARAKVLYTANTKDFQRLWTPDLGIELIDVR